VPRGSDISIKKYPSDSETIVKGGARLYMTSQAMRNSVDMMAKSVILEEAVK